MPKGLAECFCRKQRKFVHTSGNFWLDWLKVAGVGVSVLLHVCNEKSSAFSRAFQAALKPFPRILLAGSFLARPTI
jgi:hypothetical protein